MSEETSKILGAVSGLGRRRFLHSAAAVGVSAVGAVGLAGCNDKKGPAGGAASGAGAAASGGGEHKVGGAGSVEVKPGQLDTHYGLWSSGHTGDMRVLGIPSGRELLRIPCFVPDPLIGWGLTNESKAIMGTKPDGSLQYTVADTHHIHASYKDGIYDGKYCWINDKINARLARFRLDYMI